MPGKRILYVCFDPKLLVRRERLLLDQGFEVSTVLGLDGLLAAKHVRDYDLVVLGDEGSLGDRHNSVQRLKESYFPPPILALCRGIEKVPGADYQISTAGSDAWSDNLGEYIRGRQEFA